MMSLESKLTETRQKDEHNIDIETNGTKFPTFQSNDTNLAISKEITIDILLEGLDHTYKILETLKNKLEILFNSNAEIKKSFSNNQLNYINFYLCPNFLMRELGLYKKLYRYKYVSNEEPYSQFIEEITKTYTNTTFTDYYREMASQSTILFKSLNEDMKAQLYEEADILLKNEQRMLKEIENENYKPGVATLYVTCQFIEMICNDILEDLKVINGKENFTEDNMVSLFSDLARIEILANFINLAYEFSSDDIFNKSEVASKDWQSIHQHRTQLVPYSPVVIKAALQKVFDVVDIGYASVSKTFEKYDTTTSRKFGTGFYMGYYFFNKKKAKTQSKRFLMKPDAIVSQTIWNLMDTKPIKGWIKIALPRISYSEKYFLKRTESEITLDFIIDLAKLCKDFRMKDSIELPEDPTEKPKEKIKIEEFKVSYEDTNYDLLIKEKNKESDNKTDKDFVKIKFLNSKKILRKGSGSLFSFKRKDSMNKTRNALIIHIHGGGFVSMSPSSHENYTRKWANGLDIPIISIDYRLSPEHPFPKALDDCYQVYMWVVKYGEDYFKMKIDDIILAGDSAGGNLVVSLTCLLIVKKIPKLPKALFIFYPALKCCLDKLSLSYFNSITDSILGYDLLKFCVESYRGEYENTKNPFLSPLFMDDAVLRWLPPVRIFGGSSDPLRDDSIYFMERLLKLNKDVTMKEFKYFPHGYLNYDISLMMSEVALVNQIVIEEMDKFITIKK